MALTPEEQRMYAELQSEAPSFSMVTSPVAEPMDQIAQTMEQTSLPNQVLEGIQEWAPITGEIGGAITGAIQGAKRGATYQPIPQLKIPSAVVGGIVGAITGRGLGETAADLAGDEFDPLDTLSNMAVAGTTEAVGAGVFAMIGKGYRAIRNYRAGKEMTEEEIKSIAELQRWMQSQGTTLTPAQITNSGWQGTLDKIALAGFGGERQMTELFAAQNEALKTAFEQEIKMVGDTSREAAGKAFTEAVEQVENELIKWAKPQYAEIDKLAGKTPMSFQSMEQWIRGKLLSSGSNLRPNKYKDASIADLQTMKTRLNPEMEKELKLLLNNNRTITFANAFDDIKRISGKLRALKSNKLQPDKELEQFYSNLLDRYHTMLGKQAEKSGTQVYSKYKEVSEIYRTSLETIRSKSISGLIDKAPEKIGETVWSNGNVTSVKEVYRAIEDLAKTAKITGGKPVDVADLKSRFKAGYLDNLFRQVQSEMNNSASAKASTIFGQISGDPKTIDTFNAVLSKEEQGRIRHVLGWAESLEKIGAGNFSLVVRGKQSAGLRQLMNGLSVTGAAGVIDLSLAGVGFAAAITPSVLARWATSGKASQKALEKLTGLARKFEAGDFDPIRDGGALMSIVATMPLRNEDIPSELHVKGLNANEALEYHQLMLDSPSYDLLPPAKDAR